METDPADPSTEEASECCFRKTLSFFGRMEDLPSNGFVVFHDGIR